MEITKDFIQEQINGLQTKMNESLNLKNSELKAELEAKLKALENLSTKEELQNALNEIEAQKARIDKLADKSKSADQTKVVSFVKEVSESIDKIKAIANRSNGGADVVLKANTIRANVADSTQGFELPNIGQLGVKERTLYNALPKVSIPAGSHNGTIKYIDWDEATTVRAAAMVAEGGTFPTSEAKFKEYKEELAKVGDSLTVSEEFGEDQTLAAAELQRFILTNVDQKVSSELIVGDGTGNGFRGLLNRVPAYTAPNLGIERPNLKDLVRKIRTSIVKGRGSKYTPNVVILNSETLDAYALEKDANGQYLFDMNAGTIAGLTVIEDNFMPDNAIVVGDRRFAAIYEMGGVVLSEDVNGQFLQDLKSIKARKRLLMLIREVDRTGFAKVLDVNAAIEALGTDAV